MSDKPPSASNSVEKPLEQTLPAKPMDNLSVASEGSLANSSSAASGKLFGSTNSIPRSDDSRRIITLEQALDQLHLSTLMPKFEQECVDFDALVSLDSVLYLISNNVIPLRTVLCCRMIN